MATDPVTVPRPRKVPESLRKTTVREWGWGCWSHAAPCRSQLEAASPDSQGGDDLRPTGSRQHGQEAPPIPLGEVAGRGLALPSVGDLDCEEPQSLLLVLHLPEPGTRPDRDAADAEGDQRQEAVWFTCRPGICRCSQEPPAWSRSTSEPEPAGSPPTRCSRTPGTPSPGAARQQGQR